MSEYMVNIPDNFGDIVGQMEHLNNYDIQYLIRSGHLGTLNESQIAELKKVSEVEAVRVYASDDGVVYEVIDDEGVIEEAVRENLQ